MGSILKLLGLSQKLFDTRSIISPIVMQANKPAIIESTDGKYPPITAEDFVRESLRAIYVKSEA